MTEEKNVNEVTEIEVYDRPDQEVFTSTNGNTYVFQAPSSNLVVLDIIDSAEIMNDGIKMGKSFPKILKNVVIKPQNLTVDDKLFKGGKGLKELMEVCTQAVRFLTTD